MKELAESNPEIFRLETIGKSLGGLDIWVMRIAVAGTEEPDKRPALFIGANLEGIRLLGTEAAMAAINYLQANSDDAEVAKLLTTRTFYIAPLLNPDVHQMVFAEPHWERGTNLTKVNDDLDARTDEDGPDDLNGDGLITMMRIAATDGEYITDPDDTRLMRKADKMKGEKGKYKILTEGMDNDGDGELGEDPPGGVVLNRNFAHDFTYYSKTAGAYPASEPETVALLEFLISHRNIGMVFTFSGQNNLLNLQRGRGPAKIGAAKVKVPARFASFLGIEPDEEMAISEIVEIVKNLPMLQGMEVTEEMVASFFGLGPVMSIQDQDYAYFEEYSKRYKKMLEEKGIDDPSRSAEAATGDGGFITWAYFQYGVPAFTVDLWAVPEEKEEAKEAGSGITVDKLKEMTSEEFIALGEEKISLFLKEVKAPKRFDATMVVNALKGGMINPKRMAEMIEQMGGGASQEGKAKESYILKWAEENVEGGGFVPWTSFNHPTLGEVEIGGMKPFITKNPPYSLAAKVLEPNAEFVIKLAKDLASIEITGVRVKELTDGVYEITAYLKNNGFLPTSLRQGITSRSAGPIILRLETDQKNILSGNRIQRIPSIDGLSVSSEFRWVVQAKRGVKLKITATSARCGSDAKEIVLE